MHRIKAEDYIHPKESISIYSYMARGEEPAHTHDFIEMAYVYSGSGSHAVNGVDANISRGALFFINLGQSHSFHSSEGMKLVNILLQPQFISEELTHMDNALEILTLSLFEEFNGTVNTLIPQISFHGKELLEVEGIVEAMLAEYSGKKTGYRTALKGYMEVLLTRIFRSMEELPSQKVLQQMDKISPELLKYIEENCFESLTLKELAQRSFYNPTYFSTIFKNAYGCTLTEFIHEKRIQEAVRLLQESECSVEDICNRVGYRDKKQFYKLFKEYAGCTPGQLRKKTEA